MELIIPILNYHVDLQNSRTIFKKKCRLSTIHYNCTKYFVLHLVLVTILLNIYSCSSVFSVFTCNASSAIHRCASSRACCPASRCSACARTRRRMSCSTPARWNSQRAAALSTPDRDCSVGNTRFMYATASNWKCKTK